MLTKNYAEPSMGLGELELELLGLEVGELDWLTSELSWLNRATHVIDSKHHMMLKYE